MSKMNPNGIILRRSYALRRTSWKSLLVRDEAPVVGAVEEAEISVHGERGMYAGKPSCFRSGMEAL